jgi:hypothetical protein
MRCSLVAARGPHALDDFRNRGDEHYSCYIHSTSLKSPLTVYVKAFSQAKPSLLRYCNYVATNSLRGASQALAGCLDFVSDHISKELACLKRSRPRLGCRDGVHIGLSAYAIRNHSTLCGPPDASHSLRRYSKHLYSRHTFTFHNASLREPRRMEYAERAIAEPGAVGSGTAADNAKDSAESESLGWSKPG